MTTTIRSFDGETLLHIDPESAGGHWVRAQREGESGWIGDSYRRAELLAALDAVSKDDERVGAKTRAALRARAEDAEAFGAAAVTRAEEAEATIERVREELEAASTWAIAPAIREALRSALDPKPAFTLPTEAGARFTAQGNDDKPGSRTSFLTLVGGGRVVYMAVDDVRCVYEAAGVMEHYTDHRLA